MTEGVPDPIQFHGGRVRLHHGDIRDVVCRMSDVADPPKSIRKLTAVKIMIERKYADEPLEEILDRIATKKLYRRP